MMRGKIRAGFFVSSAMLTESSNPTMAKNASEVAALTARNTLLSSGVSKATTREKSAFPPEMKYRLIMMTISSPDSSIAVSTTLILTLSPTPRRLTARTRSMKPRAIIRMRPLPASSPNPVLRFAAKAREAAEAEVMPEHITAKHTMKVRMCVPNALCT
jgi:hypothetical protein